VIYRSLAVCYRQAAEELSLITGQHWSEIHVVGGGSNAVYLNELTAEETGLTVSAGPGEATAIGNIGAQMIADGVFADLADFRRCVRESFEIRTYVSGRKEENR
jgi:rhamnulokinase